MATSAVGDFSIGMDCDVVLILDGFGRIDLSEVEGFDAKAIYESPRIKPLNKRPIEKNIPMGYEGSFEVSRANGEIERLASYLEERLWTGGGVPSGTVFQYVRNPDGARVVYQFSGVSLKVGDLGSWKSDAPVKQTLSFFASKMTVTGG